MLEVDREIALRSAGLLGHIMRRDSEDPLKQVTIDARTGGPNVWNTNRVGRPYLQWYEETARFVWEHLKFEVGMDDVEFDLNDEEIKMRLFLGAESTWF